MAFDIILPNVGKMKSVKDGVISLLAVSWPLSARKLYEEIKKNYKLNISYQAVHKSLNDLYKGKVVMKIGREWQLNPGWIDELNKFGKNLKDSYSKNSKSPSINGVTTLTFDTIMELDKFCLDLWNSYFSTKDLDYVICHFKHNWWPLFYSSEEHELVKYNHNRFYFLCAGKTKIDEWCCKFEQKLGANIKSGVNCSETCDIQVLGDTVIQFYLPPEIMDDLDLIYSSVKDVKNLDINKLIERVFKKKTKILVIINKNKDLAAQIKRQTLKYFGKKLI